MNQGTSRLISLLEKRLDALEALAREIAAGQQACVSLDFETLRASDARKQSLCAEIRQLDGEITGCSEYLDLWGAGSREKRDGSAALDPETLRRAGWLRQRAEVARAEAGRLNDIYIDFLRRACATANVMANVVSHCLGVYSAPAPGGVVRLPFDRGY